MFSVLVCIFASVAYSEGGTNIEFPPNLGLVSRNLGHRIMLNPGIRHQNLELGIPQNLGLQTPKNLGFRIPQTLGLGIPNQYAINSALLRDQLLPRSVIYAVQDVPEKDVSYTLSYQDYQYLKRHKVHGQDSPYNPDPTIPSPTIEYLTGKYDQSEYNGQNKDGTHSQNHGKHSHHHDKRSDDYGKRKENDVPYSDILLKSSEAANIIDGYNNPHISVPIEPVVHKHVYFHVPPPEFEDELEAPRVIQPPKKNVNILFIKSPSYESKFSYQQLQPVEDKTLIYILSKKENPPQPVVLPPKSPSAPEVFFVNYKFSPNDITSINSELSLPNLLESISPITEQQRREISDS